MKLSRAGTRGKSGTGNHAEPKPNDAAGPSKPARARAASSRDQSRDSERDPGHDPKPDQGPRPKLQPGLYIVATPIGNLGDITLRALEILAGADVIACEDTRVTCRILARYGIDTPLLSYHEHNAARVRPAMLGRLARGEAVALVTDAGTPLVSDPGYKLVRACIAAGHHVTVAPGPAAPIAALVVSGLPPDRFFFAGFLPPRPSARREALAAIAGLDATLLFFESGRRLGASLADMARALGDRSAAVVRELTKAFEEVRRGTLTALGAHYRAEGAPRGEIVVVVGPPATAPGSAEADAAALDARLTQALAEASVRDAAAEVAAALGLSRRRVYARALELARSRARPAPGGGGDGGDGDGSGAGGDGEK